MANVFLTDEAYARLKAAKKENESFSDVIMAHISQNIDWDKYIGSCKGMNAEKLSAEIKKERHRSFK